MKISTRNVKSVRSIFTKLKDEEQDIMNKSNVVYKKPCGDCARCYIGPTKTKLKQRVALHKSDKNQEGFLYAVEAC
ncbi:hypothetical protein WA026_019328 [Henosepilachna vigintioctopunctata]|uniref:GIY-YIG homing endonuclease n=1 Tax=Henosepilachna vigintioctopunctata TaxID=420089 RepID=A0AAW1U4Z2_9CUCU